MIAGRASPRYVGPQDMRKAKRIYLDVCCLNRPFDDQSQDRVRLESEAVLTVLTQIQRQEYELVSSDTLETELDQNPDIERRHKVRDILRLASYHTHVGVGESVRARELGRHGLGAYDAAHLACAESAGADLLLTTDDAFVNKVRKANATKVRVCNPLQWIAEGDG